MTSKEEKAMNFLSVIATRKMDFYNSLLEELPESELDSSERARIGDVVSEMKIEHFMSRKELETGEIEDEVSLDELSVNVKAVIENLGYAEYFESESGK